MAGTLRPTRGVEGTACRGNRISHSRFSLVELIVVIVILVILGGIGAGVYSNVKGKRSSVAGAQRMTDTIAQARQVAISENTRVALLLPLNNDNFYNDTDLGAGLPELTSGGEHAGAAMRLCEVDEAGAFIDWLPSHGWVDMPTASYFSYTLADLEDVQEVKVTLANKTVEKRTCKGLIFKSNGTLPEPGTPSVYVRPTSRSTTVYASGSSHSYKITVSWLTGLTETTILGD